jgi:hypothetical protein
MRTSLTVLDPPCVGDVRFQDLALAEDMPREFIATNSDARTKNTSKMALCLGWLLKKLKEKGGAALMSRKRRETEGELGCRLRAQCVEARDSLLTAVTHIVCALPLSPCSAPRSCRKRAVFSPTGYTSATRLRRGLALTPASPAVGHSGVGATPGAAAVSSPSGTASGLFSSVMRVFSPARARANSEHQSKVSLALTENAALQAVSSPSRYVLPSVTRVTCSLTLPRIHPTEVC